MRRLSASEISRLAANWPPEEYWSSGASICTMTMNNRFVVHQPAMKNYVLIEYDGESVTPIKEFTNKYAARNYMHRLANEEEE